MGCRALMERRLRPNPTKPAIHALSRRILGSCRNEWPGRPVLDGRSATVAGHSRVYSPGFHRMRRRRPSCVRPCTKSYAAAVVQPYATTLRLSPSSPRPLPPPKPLHPLGIHPSALGSQPCGDPAASVAAILHRQGNPRPGRRGRIEPHHPSLALRRARPTQRAIRTALRYLEHHPHMLLPSSTALGPRRFGPFAAYATQPSGPACRAPASPRPGDVLRRVAHPRHPCSFPRRPTP